MDLRPKHTIQEGNVHWSVVSLKSSKKGALVTFRRRYCVIGLRSLFVFKGPKDPNLLGDISLGNVEVRDGLSKTLSIGDVNVKLPPDRFCFCVIGEDRKPSECMLSPPVSPRRGGAAEDGAQQVAKLGEKTVHLFGVETERERSDWVTALRAASELVSLQNARASVLPEFRARLLTTSKCPDAFSFKNEKLLLGYRSMKRRMALQKTPVILSMPRNMIYHRFGFGVCLRKFLKQYAVVHAIHFATAYYMCDFFEDVLHQLELYQQISCLHFDNSPELGPLPSFGPEMLSSLGARKPGSSAKESLYDADPAAKLTSFGVCDELSSLVPQLPSHIRALGFDGCLSLYGIQQVLTAIAQCDDELGIATLSLCNNHVMPAASSAASAASISDTKVRTIEGSVPGMELPLTIAIVNRCRTLRRLYLNGCDLGDTGATVVLDVLAKNTFLTSLGLARNKLTRHCGTALRSFLVANSTLAALDVSHNAIAEGLVCVFEVLGGPTDEQSPDLEAVLTQTNRTLAMLDISHNKIPPPAVFSLCSMLQTSTSMKYLDLSGNRFDCDCAKIIQLSIKVNRTLCWLSLAGNCGKPPPSEATLEGLNAHVKANYEKLFTGEFVAEASLGRTLAKIQSQYEAMRLDLLKKLLLSPSEVDEMHASTEFQWIEQLISSLSILEDKDMAHTIVDDYFKQNRGSRFLLGSSEVYIRLILRFFLFTASVSRRKDIKKGGHALQGWMMKRGGKRRGWRRRWFQLQGGLLRYYTGRDATRPKGIIDLEDARSMESGSDGDDVNSGEMRQLSMRDLRISQRDSLIHGSATEDEDESSGSTTPRSKEQKPQLSRTYCWRISVPGRVYHLQCESDSDRAEWMAAVGSVIQSKRERMNAIAAIAGEVQELNAVYVRMQSQWKDAHATWILQYWLPQALEFLTFALLADDDVNDENLNHLQAMLAKSTTFCCFLVTGQFLQDGDLFARFDGLRVAAQKARSDALATRMSAMKDALVGDRAIGGSQAPLSMIEQMVEEMERENFRIRVREKETLLPNVTYDVLQHSKEFRSVMLELLDHLSDRVLNEVLLLERTSVSAAGDGNRVSAYKKRLSQPFEDIIFPGTAKRISDSAQDDLIHRFTTCLSKCTILTSVSLYGNGLLLMCRWLMLHWPVAQADESALGPEASTHALKLVFVSWRVFDHLRRQNVVVNDLEAFREWQETRDLIGEVFVSLAVSAGDGRPRSDYDHVYSPLEVVTLLLTKALCSVMRSTLSGTVSQ